MIHDDKPEAAQAGLAWVHLGNIFLDFQYSYLDCRRREEKIDTHNAMVSNDLLEAAQAGLSGPRWAWADLGEAGWARGTLNEPWVNVHDL